MRVLAAAWAMRRSASGLAESGKSLAAPRKLRRQAFSISVAAGGACRPFSDKSIAPGGRNAPLRPPFRFANAKGQGGTVLGMRWRAARAVMTKAEKLDKCVYPTT